MITSVRVVASVSFLSGEAAATAVVVVDDVMIELFSARDIMLVRSSVVTHYTVRTVHDLLSLVPLSTLARTPCFNTVASAYFPPPYNLNCVFLSLDRSLKRMDI